MVYIISVIYSVLLGSLASNFVQIEKVSSGPPIDVRVNNLLSSKNASRVIFILLLFVVDWVSFMTIFPPSIEFSMRFFDVVLLLLYLPAIGVLALGAMMSLSNNDEYAKLIKWYFLFSLIGEMFWIFMSLNADVIPKQLSFFFLIIVSYFLCKGFLFFCFLMKASGKGLLDSNILFLLAFTIKPAAILLITYTTDVKIIIERL